MSLIELRTFCEVGFQIEYRRKTWREGEWKVRTKALSTLTARQAVNLVILTIREDIKALGEKRRGATYFQWMLPVVFLLKPDHHPDHKKKKVCMLACFVTAFLGPWLGMDEYITL